MYALKSPNKVFVYTQHHYMLSLSYVWQSYNYKVCNRQGLKGAQSSNCKWQAKGSDN